MSRQPNCGRAKMKGNGRDTSENKSVEREGRINWGIFMCIFDERGGNMVFGGENRKEQVNMWGIENTGLEMVTEKR